MLSDWPLALAVCVFASCWLGALLYAIAQKGASWADPVIQFLGFLALFTLPLPIRALITHEIEGDVTKHLPQLVGYLPASVLLAALAIVCFVVAYYSHLGPRLARRLPSAARPRRDPYLVVVVLGAFSLFLIARLAANAGGIVNFILLGYGASAETVQKGYLAIGLPWIYVAVFFALYRYAVYRRAIDLAIYAVCFALIFAMEMVLGARSIVLYMLLTTLLFVHFAIRRIPGRRLVPFAVVGFVLLNIAGFVRTSHYDSPSAALDQLTQGFSDVATSQELRHGWFYTLTTGEFVVPFETMPAMLRSVGKEVSPRWGGSFATSGLFFIPSVLFPTRPLPLANWYMSQFYGDERHSANEGRQFYFLAEGYLNFGPVGVALLALLWGILWRVVREYLTVNRFDPAIVLLYSLTVGFMFRLISGDFTSLLVGIPEQELVPAIFGLTMIGVWRFRSRSFPVRPV